jgi:hypothetical protein
MKEFSPKAITERVPLSFDFADQLVVGETLSGPAFAVRATRGLDGNPSALLTGAPAIVGSVVQHLVTGGVLAELYEVTCTVNSSNSQILVLRGVLPIRDPSDT